MKFLSSPPPPNTCETNSLEDLEAHLEILDACIDGLWDWDMKTGADYLSPSWKRSLGYEPDELDDTVETWESLLEPGELQKARDAVVAHLEHGEPYDVVLRYRRKNGSTAWMRARGRALKGEDGEWSRMVGTHTEMTEALTELATSRASLQALVGQNTGVIVGTASKGLDWFNEPAREILGQGATSDPSDEWAQKYGLLHLDKTTLYTEAELPLVRAIGGESVDDEYMYCRRPEDGSLRLLRVSARPIVIRGLGAGGVAIFNDGTEQLKLSEALERMERLQKELQRSNRDLSEFARVASHDLREPARTIVSFSNILHEEAQNVLSDDLKVVVGHMTSAARRMESLVSALSKYARLGLEMIGRHPVDLNDVLADSLANMAAATKESGAEFEVDELPRVVGNHVLLVQAFDNLIGNALKFRGTDAPKIVVTSAQNNDVCEIIVSDNGIGIAAEFSDRIFEPFARLHTRGQYEGSGLGLATVRRIVEGHHGSVRLIPSERGASFALSFPAVD